MHTLINFIQAKEKEAEKQQERAQEQDDDYTELSNHIHGDILTENPDVAQSAFGGHRVIPDRWKGMSPAQVQEIRATQEMQKREKEVCSLILIIMCIPRCTIVTACIHKAQSCNITIISDFMYSVCNLVACGALPDNQTMIVAFEHGH